MTPVLDFLAVCLRACLGWFERLFSAIGGFGILAPMFFVAISFGILLKPISRGGVGRSDTVKASKGKASKGNSNTGQSADGKGD